MPGVDFVSGDLTVLAGLPALLREDDIAPLAKVLGDAGRRCAHEVVPPFPPGSSAPASETHVYVCDKPELPTALVYRDSMADLFMTMLSENFRRVVYVTDRHLDRALVEREKPDVVIEEMVERSMHAPAALPM